MQGRPAHPLSPCPWLLAPSHHHVRSGTEHCLSGCNRHDQSIDPLLANSPYASQTGSAGHRICRHMIELASICRPGIPYLESVPGSQRTAYVRPQTHYLRGRERDGERSGSPSARKPSQVPIHRPSRAPTPQIGRQQKGAGWTRCKYVSSESHCGIQVLRSQAFQCLRIYLGISKDELSKASSLHIASISCCRSCAATALVFQARAGWVAQRWLRAAPGNDSAPRADKVALYDTRGRKLLRSRVRYADEDKPAKTKAGQYHGPSPGGSIETVAAAALLVSGPGSVTGHAALRVSGKILSRNSHVLWSLLQPSPAS